jgi:HSP20 family protein
MALPTIVRRGLDPLELAQREFDSMLGRYVGGRLFDGGSAIANFAVDVREDADHVFIEAELPGFKKDEVNVNLENGMLTISADRKSETENKGAKKGDWLLHERHYDRFSRSFTLPPAVDAQSVQAKLNEGVLTITLAKREETKPRKIAVS